MTTQPHLVSGQSAGDAAFRRAVFPQSPLTLVAFPRPHPNHHYGPGPHFERAVDVAVHMTDVPRPGSVIRYVDQRADEAWAQARGARALRRIRWQYRHRYLTVLVMHWHELWYDWRRLRAVRVLDGGGPHYRAEDIDVSVAFEENR